MVKRPFSLKKTPSLGGLARTWSRSRSSRRSSDPSVCSSAPTPTVGAPATPDQDDASLDRLDDLMASSAILIRDLSSKLAESTAPADQCRQRSRKPWTVPPKRIECRSASSCSRASSTAAVVGICYREAPSPVSSSASSAPQSSHDSLSCSESQLTEFAGNLSPGHGHLGSLSRETTFSSEDSLGVASARRGGGGRGPDAAGAAGRVPSKRPPGGCLGSVYSVGSGYEVEVQGRDEVDEFDAGGTDPEGPVCDARTDEDFVVKVRLPSMGLYSR